MVAGIEHVHVLGASRNRRGSRAEVKIKNQRFASYQKGVQLIRICSVLWCII